MNENEHELWQQLRREEHEKRGAILWDTRERFECLAERVVADEPKQSPATKAVNKASDSLADCRWPLEDIAAHEFDDRFAVEAFDAREPEHSETGTVESEPAPDDWLSTDCWWSPAQAATITGLSRDKMLNAARAGKFRVRAAKHGLLYGGVGVVRFADDPQNARESIVG